MPGGSKSLWLIVVVMAAVTALAVSQIVLTPRVTTAGFAAANSAAMLKMMNGMSGVASGNVDQDFAALMIPHHQGAIDMAEAELRYGNNERLRRIAQAIVVDQQQEIAALQMVLNREFVSTATFLKEASVCRALKPL